MNKICFSKFISEKGLINRTPLLSFGFENGILFFKMFFLKTLFTKYEPHLFKQFLNRKLLDFNVFFLNIEIPKKSCYFAAQLFQF